MTDKRRYDVCYGSESCWIEPHFCREWDGEVGCYGTNPDHGVDFEAAREAVASWHEQQATFMRSLTEDECCPEVVSEADHDRA